MISFILHKDRPGGRICWYHWLRDWVGSRAGLDVLERIESSCLCRKSNLTFTVLWPAAKSVYWLPYPGCFQLHGFTVKGCCKFTSSGRICCSNMIFCVKILKVALFWKERIPKLCPINIFLSEFPIQVFFWVLCTLTYVYVYFSICHLFSVCV
jgi:hypothetical protein